MQAQPTPAAQPEAKPWWQSKTIIGIAIALLPRLLHRIGIDVAADDPALTAAVNDILSAVGGALAIYGRAKASGPLSAGTPAAPVALLLGVLFSLLLPGCATDTANADANRRARVVNALGSEALRVLGRAAVSTLTNVAAAELSGGNADWGHAASSALWEQAPTIFDSAGLERVINAAADNRLPAVAATAATQFRRAVNSGVPPELAVNAIAGTISAEALSK